MPPSALIRHRLGHTDADHLAPIFAATRIQNGTLDHALLIAGRSAKGIDETAVVSIEQPQKDIVDADDDTDNAIGIAPIVLVIDDNDTLLLIDVPALVIIGGSKLSSKVLQLLAEALNLRSQHLITVVGVVIIEMAGVGRKPNHTPRLTSCLTIVDGHHLDIIAEELARNAERMVLDLLQSEIPGAGSGDQVQHVVAHGGLAHRDELIPNFLSGVEVVEVGLFHV